MLERLAVFRIMHVAGVRQHRVDDLEGDAAVAPGLARRRGHGHVDAAGGPRFGHVRRLALGGGGPPLASASPLPS